MLDNGNQQVNRQRSGKENTMEGMTDQQFEAAIKLIIALIERSESKEEAIKEIRGLLKNEETDSKIK